MDNTDVIHRVVENKQSLLELHSADGASFYFTYIYILFYLYILSILKIQLHKTTKDSNFRVLPHTHKYTNPCILIQEVCLENYVSSPLVVVKRGSLYTYHGPFYLDHAPRTLEKKKKCM